MNGDFDQILKSAIEDIESQKSDEELLKDFQKEGFLDDRFDKGLELKLIANNLISNKSFNQKAIACSIIILLALSFIFSPPVAGAIKHKFFEPIINVHELGTDIQYEKTDKYMEGEDLLLAPSYIPDGFELVDEEIEDNFVFLRYENDNDIFIIYKQYDLSSTVLSIDTENAEVHEFSYGMFEGLYIIKNKRIIISAKGDYTGCYIITNLDYDSSMKVFKSLQPLK
ncbi:MAG: DUF4367 domain-containing protein [Tissierellia bacterium]|nr:DUF4367 domain-containing protein [Tissierellia bacterium]